MAKFKFQELIPVDAITTRLGAGSGSSNQVDDKEVGKAVKLAADSRYDLCAVTNEIEGFIVAVETATADDFSIGSVQRDGRKTVTCDGLQATPGTGTIAVGDYVVAGTAVVKGTALGAVAQKVCKATGAVTTLTHKWRVVSLTAAGAVGDVALIERV